MPQISAREIPARMAVAVAVRRLLVVPITGVFYNNLFFVCKQQSMPRATGGKDAVEHVDSPADAADDVLRRAHAHQVAGPVFRQERGRSLDGFVHELPRLSDADAADGIPVEADGRDLLCGSPPQFRIGAALDDSEQRLVMRRLASSGPYPPIHRQFQGFLSLFPGAGIGRAFIQAHHDVRPDRLLDREGLFRSHEVSRTVDVRLEEDPFRRDLAQLGQAVDLEAAAVGEDRFLPAHEAMKSSGGADRFAPGTEVEVIGVGEDHFHAEGFGLGGQEGLERPLRAHGHEGGRLYRAVRRYEPACPRAAAGVSSNPLEAEGLSGCDHRPCSFHRMSMQSP